MRMIALTFLLLWAAGCSSLRPSTKSQTMTILSFGLPAVAFVTETHMSAENSGDDEADNKLEATNDVKPNIEVPVEVQ